MVITEEKKCTCNISSSFFPSIFPTVISLVPFKMFEAAWGSVLRWWMFAASRRYFCFGYSDCKGGFHSTRLSTAPPHTCGLMWTLRLSECVLMWPNQGIPPLLSRITYSYPQHFPDCGDYFWPTRNYNPSSILYSRWRHFHTNLGGVRVGCLGGGRVYRHRGQQHCGSH